MRVRKRLSVGVIGLSIVGTSAGAQQTRMPIGSYLKNPATTTPALTRQVGSDPTVMKRYVTTFHLPPSTIKSAFARLKLIHLTKDGIYQVHYVHPGEHLGYRVRRVRKGTLVYATSDGTPILAQVCGNPLRSSPNRELLNAGNQNGRSTVPDFQPNEPRMGLASDLTPTESVMRSVTPTEDQEVIPETVAGVVESPLPPVPISPLPDAGLSAWARGALAAGVIGGLLGGGGGGGSNTPSSPPGSGGLQGGGTSGSDGIGGSSGDPGGGGGGSSDSGGGSGGLHGGGTSGSDGNGGSSGDPGGGGGGTTTTPEPDVLLFTLSAGTTLAFYYNRHRRQR